MTTSRWLRTLVPATIGLVVLVVLFPKVTGASWDATFAVLRSISLLDAGLLAAVWFAGLCCYTLVLRASLPGLSVPRALTLNLGGSAVSNLLPFGGAAGVGLNFAMARSWGFRRSSFATFSALTTLVNVAAKLSLPVVAALAVSATGQLHSRTLVVCAQAEGGLLLAAVLLVALSVTDNPVARLNRRMVAGLASRGALPHRVGELRGRVVAVATEAKSTVAAGWQQICLGMGGYLALQALLLWLILDMLHSGLPVIAVFAGFALERALTLAVVTPGGVGIAQTGAAAALIALGGDPAVVAAGVLLYSVFTFFVEIPVGAVATLGWWMRHRAPRATPPPNAARLVASGGFAVAGVTGVVPVTPTAPVMQVSDVTDAADASDSVVLDFSGLGGGLSAAVLDPVSGGR